MGLLREEHMELEGFKSLTQSLEEGATQLVRVIGISGARKKTEYWKKGQNPRVCSPIGKSSDLFHKMSVYLTYRDR